MKETKQESGHSNMPRNLMICSFHRTALLLFKAVTMGSSRSAHDMWIDNFNEYK
jgi:hypothetical protein